jgi:glutamine synthetase
MVSEEDAGARLADRLDEIGASTVHAGAFDFAAAFRERRLKREDLVEGAGTARFANVPLLWDLGEALVFPGPYGPVPVRFDIESLRPSPFEPDAAYLVADYEGDLARVMPRHLLKAQIGRAESLGFDVHAAFEFEFIVLRETAESLREKNFAGLRPFAPDNRCWSGLTAAAESGFVSELERLLAVGGIDLVSLGFELGPGCFEATLRHKPALRAADDAAFFRMFTKAFCRQKSMTASFMALTGAGFPGIGGHINLSLTERGSTRNAFAPDGSGQPLSQTGLSFLAGLIASVPDGFAMLAHTVNSYRRFAPGGWSPKSVSWGTYNYAAAVNVSHATPQSTRMELRLPGSDVNPHLALALMVGSGLDGIERGLKLTVPPLAGAASQPAADKEAGFPADLLEASRRLRSSDRMRTLFGQDFVQHFASYCEAEDASLRKAVSAAEVARYLESG